LVLIGDLFAVRSGWPLYLDEILVGTTLPTAGAPITAPSVPESNPCKDARRRRCTVRFANEET
jgi:hypothetical protein